MSATYRKEVDGLRAIAVLSVIVNHIDKTLMPNGYLGVDIFYVISGFFITQSLISKQRNSFKSYLIEFYNRRIKRLFPALFICIAVTCLFIFLVTSPGSSLSGSSILTGISALFGLSNLYLLIEAKDYFGSSAELNPFTHTWSLSVEWQFYALFPFFFWFSGASSKTRQGFRNFFLIIGSVAIASLLAYISLSDMNPIAAFYLMPTRFWEIALGAIACMTLIKSQSTVYGINRLPQYVSLAALLALICVLLLPQKSSQMFTTIVVVILTTIIVFGIRPLSLSYRILTIKPLPFLGVISYSLYLWHWSGLAISRLTVGVNIITIPFQLTAIFLLAFLSYQYVEKPLRQAEWIALRLNRFQLREVGHAMALAFGLAIVTLFIVSPLHSEGYLYLGEAAPMIKKGGETLKDTQIYKGNSWTADQCVLSSKNDVGKTINLDNCTFGDFWRAKRNFLVVGDSFSVAEIEMYKTLVAEDLGSVTITSSWGASPVPEVQYKSRQETNQYYWNSVIPNLTNQLSAGDVLLIVNDGVDFSPKILDEESKQMINNLENGLVRISEEMSKRGINVLYQSSNPFIRESNCTPDSAMHQWWNYLSEPPCTYYTREESLERRRIYHDTLLSIQAKFKNFAVLDLFDVFCPSGLCKFYNREGVFLYRDEWTHPSVEAAILSQPLLLETVEKLIMKAT